MKTFLNALLKGIQDRQKARVLHMFQNMSDRQLADIGISRHLLSQGVQAFPWHEAEAETAKQNADIMEFPQRANPIATSPRLAA